MSNNALFIDHEDPTKKLDFSDVSLEQQYALLTEEEKMMVYLRLNGYSHKPPTVERLYSDPYYLGSDDFFMGGNIIFDFWKNDLPKIFPNEVLTLKPYLVLSGAIGIGKSTISRICLAMTYARLGCMTNPYKTFGLAQKPMSAVIFHKSEETAIKEFKYWFERDVLVKSPFFKNIPNRPDFKIITSGPRGGGGLGSDVIFFLLGEVNFWPNQENAVERVHSSLIRFSTRYGENVTSKAGHFIVDSSAKGDSSATEVFLENTDPRLTYNCRPAHYDVRVDMYRPSKGKTFSVYIGDGKRAPQILPDDYVLEDTMDPDRIKKIPIQLLGQYKGDLIKSLQDLSGISVGSSDLFFGGSIQHLVNCSNKRNKIPEIVKVDFFDKEDRIYPQVQKAIDDIPLGTFLFLGLDLAVAKDTSGIAAVSFDHWEEYSGAKVAYINCHFCFGVTRLEGQETSLFHIYQFIKELSTKFRIIVSADIAFSKNILQDLERDGIVTRYISTDRTSEPAYYLKNVINRELISLPENKRLQREAYDLKIIGDKGKVDHPKRASISNLFDNPDGKQPGSKDLWDALSNCVYSLNLSSLEGEELGYDSAISKQNEVFSKLNEDVYTETTKVFQDMIQDLF